MPNGIRVKQYRPSGPIKVVRSADSSSNSIVWKASKTSTMVNTLAFFKRGSFSSIVGMVYTGLRIALFIVWLGSIHILMFPLGFSFTSMFDNQSVGCVTGLIVPLSQSLDNSSLTLSSLDTGMRRLGTWTCVTLGSISIYAEGFRGASHALVRRYSRSVEGRSV